MRRIRGWMAVPGLAALAACGGADDTADAGAEPPITDIIADTMIVPSPASSDAPTVTVDTAPMTGIDTATVVQP